MLIKKVKNEGYDTFFEFKQDFEDMRHEYSQAMADSDFKNAIFDRESLAVMMQASELFFQKLNHSSNLELKKLQQHNSLLEAELRQ